MESMESQKENKFESMLYQTEIERIEKYTLYLLRQPDLKELLSSQEIGYARRYQELIESHNHDSFLHQLPRSQHKQDEISVDMNMVVEPNLDAPVFCRVLSDIGHVEINNDSVLFEPNDIYILRYSDVRDYLKEKKVKLI
ncbi:GINS complex subunit Sld5 [Mucor ambiguus]|uniref:GINS complex subunit Sld5 n=1 Tax=Mucor ambiguus TaxID=91626 RepID=A0A0C9MFR8_9FUNG|nr:GINS complex subunit Sld5 [Mucor ambiguus]